MERIGQTNVKVRASYAKITDQNGEVIDAINLLIYAGEHPEHKREVEEWILKKGISVADMAPYVPYYPKKIVEGLFG